MAVTIGPKIGIEGEVEYRREINNIIQQAKTLDSEMKRVESTFDETTTAEEKAAAKTKILSDAVEVQKKRVAAVNDMYEKSRQVLGDNDAATLKWKQALNNAKTELNNTEKELKEAEQAAGNYNEEVEESTEETKNFGQSISDMMANEKLADFFGKLGDAAGKVSKAAVDAAKELDEGYDTIVMKTGATGAALEELKGIANDVYGSMPVEMADVGAAVGEVNTRFGQTGQELQQTSTAFLQFSRITGRDVSDAIDSTDRIMKIFGVDASETENVLGMFAKTSQETGLSADRLMSALDSNGATFNELGIDIGSAAAMLAEFELNGVDTSTAMTAMKKAIVNAAKSGKNAGDVLSDTADAIRNASSETEALQIASQVFGTRGAVAMVDGLRSGRISLDQTTAALEDYADVVAETYEATISPWDKTTQMMNNVKRAGSDLAGAALSTLQPAMEKITGVVQRAADKFSELPPGVQTTIGVVTGVGAAAAKVVPEVLSFVNTIKGIKTASEVAKGVRALSSATESAEKSQKAFNIAALANPYVLLIAGVAAATAAIAGLAYHFAEADAEAVQMKADAEALAGAVNETSSAALQATQSATAQIAQMEAENKVADELIKTVSELAEKENKSADEVTQLRKAVKDLNSIYPDLNLAYDEAADKLNMTNEEMIESIKLTRAQAEAAAYAKILTEAIARQMELEINQEAAVKQLTDAYGQYGDTINKVRSKGAANIWNMDEAKTAKYAADTIDTLTETVEQNTQAIDSNQAIIDVATQHLEELGNTVDPVTGEITDQNGELVETAEAAGDAADALEGLTDAEEDTGEQAEATADEIAAAAQKILESYESTKESAHDSVMSQKGLWKELEQTETTSIAEMRKGLQSHIQAYQNYNNNARALLTSSEYETSEAFQAIVNAIISGGMDMAAELDAVYEAWQNGDEELSALIAEYGEMDQLAEDMGDNLASATTVAEYGLDALRRSFEQAGIPTSAKGIKTKSLKEIDDMLTGINGKSYASYQAGKNVADSTGKGAQDGNKTLVTAAGEAEGTVDSANKEIDGKKVAARSAGEAVGGGYASGMGSQTSQVAAASQGLVAAVEQPIQILRAKPYGWGAEFAQQFANGINSKGATITSAAKNIADTVARYLHFTVPDAGPLKHADEWGYEFGEQYAESMVRSIPLVASAAQQVAVAAAGASPAGYIDLNMMNGGANAFDYGAIYDAVRAGASESNTTVVIGNREFARILRDVGVNVA